MRADLPFVLTGKATIWVELERLEASAYHLCHPYNVKSFLAVEYINDQWYYLDWNHRRYYTGPLLYITMPISLGLGTLQTPAINIALFPREPVETASESMGPEENKNILDNRDEPVLLEEQMREGEQLADTFNCKIMITRPITKKAFAFRFNAMSSAKMATMTMLTSTTIGGLDQREDVDMYHVTMPMGPGGRQDGEGSHSLAFGGSSPLP